MDDRPAADEVGSGRPSIKRSRGAFYAGFPGRAPAEPVAPPQPAAAERPKQACIYSTADGKRCNCNGLLHRSTFSASTRYIAPPPRAEPLTTSTESESTEASRVSDESEPPKSDEVTVQIADHQKESFPTKAPLFAGEELRHPKHVLALAPFFKGINLFLMIACMALGIVPLVLAIVLYGASPAVAIFSIGITVLCFLLIIPFWTLIWNWHPCLPHEVEGFTLRTLDVVVTTYKEPLDVVIGTIEATQRIDYDPDYLRVYVLDDGRRRELEQFCSELNTSNKARFPVTYVTRANNKGRKGGNINNWIREYDDVASEFFIILDADMQPFPDVAQTLFGHYYGFETEERNRIAFIQAPQHFRNHIHKRDPFEVGMTFFYKAILPCMDAQGIVMYIGTCALWRRAALLSGGGFHEQHATEDSVTGCRVHRTKVDESQFTDTQWMSKFVMKPVAVGVSPATLPDLIDQRLRWCLGSVEMFFEHRWFIGASELNLSQRMMYFCSVCYWFTGLGTYLINMTETLTFLIYIVIAGYYFPNEPTTYPFHNVLLPFIAFPFYFAILPVASGPEKLRALQMFSTYTPVYLAAVLRYSGLPLRVQSSVADGAGNKRWHPLYIFHIATLFIVFGVSAAALTFGRRNATNIGVVVLHIIYWLVIYYPVLRSMSGFVAKERPRLCLVD